MISVSNKSEMDREVLAGKSRDLIDNSRDNDLHNCLDNGF